MSCVICGLWKCTAHAGYKGQRYEVRFSDGSDPVERVFGWTDDPSGGAMVKSIDAHPVWRNPRVVDLERGTVMPHSAVVVLSDAETVHQVMRILQLDSRTAGVDFIYGARRVTTWGQFAFRYRGET